MLNIAIDGPAGAGKSTVAKMLAKNLNIVYLDTGAMYRGVAYYVIQKGVDPASESAVIPLLDGIQMDILYENGMQKVMICGDNVTPFIREHNISMAASTVSKIPAVRIKLVELQREIAAKTPCVLDGRDIGSYVLPDAPYKFYMTATPEERAKRRHLELMQKGVNISYQAVLDDITARDYQDSNRAFAPLKATEDAIIIDTTDLTPEQTAEQIMKKVCS
ncbi:MAG: (d)CMP kinase [Clostridia bacterium]|nr:(d)CMP kinase [Clostridia bacterium]